LSDRSLLAIGKIHDPNIVIAHETYVPAIGEIFDRLLPPCRKPACVRLRLRISHASAVGLKQDSSAIVPIDIAKARAVPAVACVGLEVPRQNSFEFVSSNKKPSFPGRASIAQSSSGFFAQSFRFEITEQLSSGVHASPRVNRPLNSAANRCVPR